MFRNLKIAVLGDGISVGKTTALSAHSSSGATKNTHTSTGESWVDIVGRTTGAHMQNLSVSDSKMSSFSYRLTDIWSDTDIIIVFGGVNDWGDSSPTDLDTFRSSVHSLIQNDNTGLIQNFPTARLLFLTPLGAKSYSEWPHIQSGNLNANGKSIKEYGDVIIDRCRHFSSYYINLLLEAGITTQNAAHCKSSLTQGFFHDGLHPNDNGHGRIAAAVIHKLRTMV